MRSALVVAAAVCLLLAAVAMEAPATLADQRLDGLSGGRLRLADASGTIWNGSGALVLLPSGARVPVAWNVDMLPLLRGHVSGDFGRDGSEVPRAAFDVASGDFAIRRFNLALPAEALLRSSGAPSLIAAAGGTLDIRADEFVMHSGAFGGGFVVRWQGASVPGLRPDVRFALGDVRLDAIANGSDIKGTLSNVAGEVEITGALAVTTGGALRVDVRLKPRPGIDKERLQLISSAVAMVGTPEESGGFRVLWQTPGR